VKWRIVHIDETDSTNSWLKNVQRSTLIAAPNSQGENVQRIVVWTEYQTAGRGCGTNLWESERGKNLTFSMLIQPKELPATQQFHLSMAISLAICDALGQYIGDVSIKWPNDIYWRNGKIGGILIENTLKGSSIMESIIGVGLNVNQRVFKSDAPNPVSMWQICEHETDRETLLKEILEAFERRIDHLHCLGEEYLAKLYRRQGYHPYADKDGAFMAEIVTVEDDGQLVLHDDNGKERRYAFKEVQFII
jgi:BirA family biotin operon repressor/biotin-[acetyl-CoA-carboxylase] ligase